MNPQVTISITVHAAAEGASATAPAQLVAIEQQTAAMSNGMNGSASASADLPPMPDLSDPLPATTAADLLPSPDGDSAETGSVDDTPLPTPDDDFA